MDVDRPGGNRSGGRRRAVALAGHRGDVAAARAHLDDADPSVRATALGALARAGGLTEADVARGLLDPSPEVRRRALQVGCAFGGDTDLDLVALLGDDEATVVEVAAWALGEQQPPDPRACAALCEVATDHPDALCRESAVAALGAIGDPAGLPAILGATTDIATVRRRAVIALAPFEGPDVDAALARATEDRDWQVRQAAEDLLAD